jgi:hypothetical protein
MDKHILHSVLESLTIGQALTINFTEQFTDLTGDYTVLVSKTGRGRGGSRVIEIASVTNPSETFGALNVDGKDKLLGTGTSEFIGTIVIGDKTYGLEDPIETARKTPNVKAGRVSSEGRPATKREVKQRGVLKSSTAQAGRVAKALSEVLTANPVTTFNLVATVKTAPYHGEWSVSSYAYEEGVLKMSLVGLNDPDRKFDFDSSLHGTGIKDAQVVSVAGSN